MNARMDGWSDGPTDTEGAFSLVAARLVEHVQLFQWEHFYFQIADEAQVPQVSPVGTCLPLLQTKTLLNDVEGELQACSRPPGLSC